LISSSHFAQTQTISINTKICSYYFFTLFGTTFSYLIIIKNLKSEVFFYQIVKKGPVEKKFLLYSRDYLAFVYVNGSMFCLSNDGYFLLVSL